MKFGRRQILSRGYRYDVEGTERYIVLSETSVDRWDVLIQKASGEGAWCMRIGSIGARDGVWSFWPSDVKPEDMGTEALSMRECVAKLASTHF